MPTFFADGASSSSTFSTSTTRRQVDETKSEYGYPLYRLRVLFIRHGESQNNVMYGKSPTEYRRHRFADPDLSPRGVLQAEACGQYLAAHESFGDFNPIMGNVEALYVSPMLRTLRTAQPIGLALGLVPEIWSDIYEVSGLHKDGVGQGGLSRNQMLELFPNYNVPKELQNKLGWYPVQRGRESRAMAIPRIASVVDRLYSMAASCLKQKKSKTIALVCHGDFKDMVLQEILGLSIPIDKKKRFLSYNTAITVVDLDVVSHSDNGDENEHRHATLLLQNFAGHLNSTLITHEDLGIV